MVESVKRKYNHLCKHSWKNISNHESHLHLATEKRHALTIFGCCIHIQNLHKHPFWIQNNTTICVDSHGIIYLFFGVKVERCQTRESTKNTWEYQKRTRIRWILAPASRCVFMDLFLKCKRQFGFGHFWATLWFWGFWWFWTASHSGFSENTSSLALFIAPRVAGLKPQPLDFLKLTAKAPENRPSQKEIHLPTIHFQGQTCRWFQGPGYATKQKTTFKQATLVNRKVRLNLAGQVLSFLAGKTFPTHLVQLMVNWWEKGPSGLGGLMHNRTQPCNLRNSWRMGCCHLPRRSNSEVQEPH